MSYAPGYAEVTPPMVSAYTFGWSLFGQERIQGSYPASATWAVANTATYLPIIVPTVCTVRRLWWTNGATASASYNIDCGIYLDAGYKPGARLISTGSTAQGTASEIQFVDVTDTTLMAGRYWLALVCSSTVATLFRASAVAQLDAMWKFDQGSALPLPATATPVEATTSGIFIYGFATTASP